MEGQVVFVARWWRRRCWAGRVVPAAGWLSLKEEERREEGDDDAVGPVAPCADEEVEGRVDVCARASRLEEEVEGNCEVGAVELRRVEGRCDDVVGREDVFIVVEL